MNRDGENSARVTASASIRSMVLIALISAAASSTAPSCTGRQDEIVTRLDRLEQKVDSKLERVATAQSRLSDRLARLEGARGTSGDDND